MYWSGCTGSACGCWRVDVLDQRVAVLEWCVDVLDQRVDVLEWCVDVMEQRVDVLERRVDVLERRECLQHIHTLQYVQ